VIVVIAAVAQATCIGFQDLRAMMLVNNQLDI
jgi:hypothetical protein